MNKRRLQRFGIFTAAVFCIMLLLPCFPVGIIAIINTARNKGKPPACTCLAQALRLGKRVLDMKGLVEEVR